MNKPHYFIRTKMEFDSISKAKSCLQHLQDFDKNYEVGYHMPQPIYKSWVPKWVIRLIIKS